ncbi:uncharacterized protein BP01DRAFT_3719 [Aspergillus saccharolyticus JOP 1030-1]|uniref:Major facilitator superfamily (MFS) profile domain-containing protein n=1 Tax=Aspergillus saccharolyticus JOP 1030-1 TaxID=1450539 RepID=A0A319AE19_9EURO|nr:hypothetical protein BP01DRAFT_3719 [Aspergillus saccharolyticus JOP 1030-1]PYH49708.1 hypothetical protein BP01DRAFT_3719 [Aspergillus saccharolyticus JOP 1030-1]
MTMKVRLPPDYVFASILVTIGNFSNGFDTGSIGALLSLAQFSRSIGHDLHSSQDSQSRL